MMTLKVTVPKPPVSIKKACKDARDKQLWGSVGEERRYTWMKSASHSIEKIVQHPTRLTLHIKILDTKEGLVLQSLMDSGLGIEFRPLIENGRLYTFNAVAVEKTVQELIQENPQRRGSIMSKSLGIL